MTWDRLRLIAFGRAFADNHMFLSSPDGAVCRCGEISRILVGLLDKAARSARGVPTEARLLHLTKPRKKFPRRHEYWKKNPKLFEDGHVVVVIGNWTIDLTRRQLDPRSPHPFVQHINRLKLDWNGVKRLEWTPPAPKSGERVNGR